MGSAVGTKFSSTISTVQEDISDLQADGTKLSSTISTVQDDISDLKDRDVGLCDCQTSALTATIAMTISIPSVATPTSTSAGHAWTMARRRLQPMHRRGRRRSSAMRSEEPATSLPDPDEALLLEVDWPALPARRPSIGER